MFDTVMHRRPTLCSRRTINYADPHVVTEITSPLVVPGQFYDFALRQLPIQWRLENFMCPSVGATHYALHSHCPSVCLSVSRLSPLFR